MKNLISVTKIEKATHRFIVVITRECKQATIDKSDIVDIVDNQIDVGNNFQKYLSSLDTRLHSVSDIFEPEPALYYKSVPYTDVLVATPRYLIVGKDKNVTMIDKDQILSFANNVMYLSMDL